MEMMVAVRETVKMMTTQEMSERTIQDPNKKECKEVDAKVRKNGRKWKRKFYF